MIKLTNEKIAVDQDYFWQPMNTCPLAVKVQLLGAGGVATYGNWDGYNTFWKGWAPLPKKGEKQMKDDPIDQLAWECGFMDEDFDKLRKFSRLIKARAFLEGFDAGMNYQQVINEREENQ